MLAADCEHKHADSEARKLPASQDDLHVYSFFVSSVRVGHGCKAALLSKYIPASAVCSRPKWLNVRQAWQKFESQGA